jgi:transposase-like protein/IS1 family transposase
MRCPTCESDAQRFGTNRNGSQRFRCVACKKTFSGTLSDRVPGSTIPLAGIEKVLQLLLEGCSVRSAERISGLHRDTILKLLVTAGEQCEKLLGRLIISVPVKDVQCDEMWGFIQKKEKMVTEDDDPNYGDAYCFVAMETSTKLVLNFALGKRNQVTTDIFIEGLRHATSGYFQITTDGFGPYRSAIPNTLQDRASFAQLIKVYRAAPEGERRYSPAEVVKTEVVPVMGDPDPKFVCTSHIERQNLTMRMQMRRLTRLTNGFSKKWENHWAALCLHFAYYNFCRIHRTLRVTPAMAAGITDHVWDLSEVLARETTPV